MTNYRSIVKRLLVGCACALALIPGLALAKTAPAHPLGKGYAQIVAQATSDEERDAFAPEEGFALQTRASKPAYFDLRHVDDGNGGETSYVTPVRQQNPYGTCWGFGAIAAAESSLLALGIATDPETLNLSEKQIVWFNANAISDPESSQAGEGMTFGIETTPEQLYNAGGTTVYATGLFASGVGPTSEDTDTNYGQIFRYSGLNGEVVNSPVTWIDGNGQEQQGFRKTYFSENDDWTMPEAYRYWQDYRLVESYLLPSPSSCKTEEELAEAIDAIKNQLLSHHAVAINFWAETSQPGQEADDSSLSENWAQYEDFPMPSNHVVTIIGYDDTYPKGNFVNEPPHDGAWLVKNSWGSDLNSFPDNGYRHWGCLEGQDIPGSSYEATSQQHTGYFWLSYYDRTIRDPEAYLFEGADSDMVIDQYDFMPVMNYERYTTDTPSRMANIFVAEEDEKLEDISFITTTPGMSVSYRVFLLEDDATGPEDGVCVASADGLEYPLGGYHRVSLDEGTQPVLAQGQRYAIVVEQRTPAGTYSVTVNESLSEEQSYNGSVWITGVVNKGESFFYVDGAWRDLADDSIRGVLEDSEASIDNFSIKAYASPTEASPSHQDQPDPPEADESVPYLEARFSTGPLLKDFELAQNETVKIRCTIKGATDDIAVQPTFTWRSSDESVFTIEVNEAKQGAEAIIRPVHHGEAYLSVDAGIYGSIEVLVTVPKFSLLDATLKDGDRETVYTGQPFEPDPIKVRVQTVDYSDNYDVYRDVDYVVSYENNVLCGRGETVITGIGEYIGELRSAPYMDLSFIILPAKAQITGITAGTDSIEVTWESQEASGISGYVLSFKESGESEAAGMTVDANATSATLMGLNAKTGYEISLSAFVITEEMDEEIWEYIDVYHFGEASDPVTVTTGSAVTGWFKEGGYWYFYDETGHALRDQWLQYGSAWYHFADDGTCQWSTWVSFEGSWYYLGSDGKAVWSTWVKSGGFWYYIGTDGTAVWSTWVPYKGKWYYVDAHGRAVWNTWVEYNGREYYIDGSGVATGKSRAIA